MNFTIPIENFRIDITNLHITTDELECMGVNLKSNDDTIEVIGKKRSVKFLLSSFNCMERKVYLQPAIHTKDNQYLLIITDTR